MKKACKFTNKSKKKQVFSAIYVGQDMLKQEGVADSSATP
ncbi:hypothetical protein HMPREF1551_00720 [Capnocytophaga sp. oral taxon 863 str. F0517]|nr:hypothetical protein HMPREF1551_00720 [Capnocytophaga sp. oral taxon 863 str. F0517]